MAPRLVDQFYQKTFFGKLTRSLTKNCSSFNSKKFLAAVKSRGWTELPLLERKKKITVTMHKFLPKNYEDAIEIIKPVAETFPRGSFEGLVFPYYVQKYGLEDLDLSLDALKFLTPYSSSEMAIRPFIMEYEDETMERMLEWADDEDDAVRRLASEGCRPRLPWAPALPAFKRDPSPIIPILEKLRTDESLYVRKSVANNLNDISKDHPELVLELARKWKGSHKHTDWILKQACRTLLKAGNAKALEIFGWTNVDTFLISNFKVSPKTTTIGDSISMKFSLTNTDPNDMHSFRVEYGIYYVKSNGSANRKIFQLAQKEIESEETVDFQKKISFKQLSTRVHYPGKHKIVLVINGKESSSCTI
eukprot:CAMPEP_0115006628 /NCGR_PEP_ID=MMETSP0216-20121206/20619_1 /TAXON_ID=223996 /ORGANISM="Protocruzia adherens, Strain Boccale" /LENGTH=361 /DNA_ID=CAMNT_0002373259 /DNA_START=77 /DNA_END=1159 /DNA_ORIENTATION=+